MTDYDLNPDGPHSPQRTAEVGQLFDDVSRLLCYATMPGKGGLEFPADVYSLVADMYSAAGRFPQVCEQLDGFLAAQAATGRLYEARGRDVTAQVREAAAHLLDAGNAALAFTRALQAVQADISGLGWA
jgi:hypothetical protein